jgi:alkylation response protein AidB-like acyl-CoA dehydrogenase
MSEKAGAKEDLPDLLYSDTERALSDALASLLADRGGVDSALKRIESAQTYDDKLWATVAGDLGCAGLLIPERDGGAGASYREAAAAAEVLGAHVAPVPFLGSAVVATAALLSVASQGDLLAKMADGGVTAALAVPFATAPGAYPNLVRVAGPRPGDAAGTARLRGLVAGVADALPAGVLLVPADGVPHGLYLVDVAAEGVGKAPVTSLDMTRQLCDLSFDDAPATLIASGPAAGRALDAALAAGAGMLAAEQLGLAQRCLDMTLAYVKERKQFARPAGA